MQLAEVLVRPVSHGNQVSAGIFVPVDSVLKEEKCVESVFVSDQGPAIPIHLSHLV